MRIFWQLPLPDSDNIDHADDNDNDGDGGKEEFETKKVSPSGLPTGFQGKGEEARDRLWQN